MKNDLRTKYHPLKNNSFKEKTSMIFNFDFLIDYHRPVGYILGHLI